LNRTEFDRLVRAYGSDRPVDAKCADPWVWCGRGLTFLEKNDPASAIPDFDEAIYLAPNFAQAYCLRGRACAMLGDYPRAKADLTAAIRLKPDYALAYMYRADANCNDKVIERALADLKVATGLNQKSDPSDQVFRREAGLVYVEICKGQARQDRANGLFDNAFASLASIERPKLPVIPETLDRSLLAQEYEDLALVCMATKNWDRAIDSFTMAINEDTQDKERAERLQPKLALAYAERGFARAGRSKFELADADFKAVARFDLRDARIWRLAGSTSCLLAKHYHDCSRITDERVSLQDAIYQLREAVSLDPGLEYVVDRQIETAQHNLGLLGASLLVTSQLPQTGIPLTPDTRSLRIELRGPACTDLGFSSERAQTRPN
jgi:tetratricopeptide (TPR) repeat protein